MSLSAALHAVVAALRRRPSDLLPFYLLGAAVPAIARVGAFLGLGVAYAYLRATGRLASIVAALSNRDLSPPGPAAPPAATAQWAEGVVQALTPLSSPVVVGAVAAGLLLALLAMVVLSAAASAGQFAACHARLRDERGLLGGIDGFRRHWPSFLGVYLLEGAIWAVVTLLAVVVTVVGFVLNPVVGAATALLAGLLWIAVVAAVRAVFAFAPVAIVVDGAGALRSLHGSLGFIRRNPIEAAGYYAIALGTLAGFTTVVVGLTLVRAGAAGGPIALLVLSPALDLLKTGLYGQHRGSFDPPAGPRMSPRVQVVGGLRRGIRELAAFVRRTPGTHALVLVVGTLGTWMGWAAASPFVGAIDASIVARLSGRVPPAAALAYFGNNLTVALATAYSGVALSVPAALSVWVNGAILGAVARLEVDPAVLVAFVVPHGVFEFPALVVSGALGFHLGAVWWRTWRGTAGREALAEAFERAFWVLVGVGALLAVAALLEGFVSPYYWRPFL